MKNTTLVSIFAWAVAPFGAMAQETVPAVADEGKVAEKEPTKIVIELPELPSTDSVKVKVSGLVQAQYVSASSSGSSGSDQNGFSIRRSQIGVSADIGENWSAKVVYEYDSKSSGGTEDNGYIDTATIARKFASAGTLTVGHKKTHFMLEEYSPSSKFPCLERSLNSNFVNGNSYVKGLSGYHIGVFWEGVLPGKVEYGLSLTNAVAKDYDSKSNDLALTGNAGYKVKFSEKQSLYLGLNGTVNFGDDGGTKSTALSNAGTVYGIEPFVRYDCGGFMALADAFYIDDCGGAKLSRVYGVNLTATYKFDCGLEPAVRLTYLNTNSGLVNASTQNRVPATKGNDMATTCYAGVNYYFNKYVKVAAGYEYGHYFGGDCKADSGAFRTMLQISF